MSLYERNVFMEKYFVCEGCLFAIANNDFSVIDAEREEYCREGIRALSEDGGYLVCGEDFITYSIDACECCEDELDGSRYEVFLI